MAKGRFVALLRGVNVGGQRKVPMADLRELAEAEGLENVETYVASGNLVFTAAGGEAALETRLEAAIEKRFGFAVDVMVRSAAHWRGYLKSNPFPRESEAQANFVMLALSKGAASEADVERLRAQASANERVERRDEVLWLYFGDGAGRSKMASGRWAQAWTLRNWRTVVKLGEMLEA